MALEDLKLPPITFHKAAHYTKGRNAKIKAFVNHRMVGTLKGTTAYFQNPATRPVSTHFGIGKIDGEVVIHQYVPLDDTAYANGNYDVSGKWDNWGYSKADINAQTISIEHQDHWGNADLKGIVKPEVQEAAKKLWALLRWGSIAQWKKAGITIRDWDGNAPILLKEIRAIPVDGKHVITHNDIAGKLKPYCWLPWKNDKVGFPRSQYIAGIIANKAPLVGPAEPPPVVDPPVPPPDVAGEPKIYTQAEMDTKESALKDAVNLNIDLGREVFELKARALRAKEVLDGA